jgi:hypothetical protein
LFPFVGADVLIFFAFVGAAGFSFSFRARADDSLEETKRTAVSQLLRGSGVQNGLHARLATSFAAPSLRRKTTCKLEPEGVLLIDLVDVL